MSESNFLLSCYFVRAKKFLIFINYDATLPDFTFKFVSRQVVETRHPRRLIRITRELCCHWKNETWRASVLGVEFLKQREDGMRAKNRIENKDPDWVWQYDEHRRIYGFLSLMEFSRKKHPISFRQISFPTKSSSFLNAPKWPDQMRFTVIKTKVGTFKSFAEYERWKFDDNRWWLWM